MGARIFQLGLRHVAAPVVALVYATTWVSVSGPSYSQSQFEEAEFPSQVFTVTSTADTESVGTLRNAITSANANPGLDTIAFNISGSGVQTISLGSALPAITDPVVIDGSTQAGYSGEPLIRLGASVGGIPSVINITGGGSTVRALTFNFFSGVTVGNAVIRLASSGNVVAACAGGSGNSQVLIDGSTNNRIGGSTPADRNIWYNITSNRDIVIVRGPTATGNRIVGNWFGTTPAGVRQVNAGRNIFIENAPNNFVGGPVGTTPGGACTGECNLISGTGLDGVTISGATATGNTVVGNFVGLTPNGLDGNRNGNYGIHLIDASNNHIGGSNPTERNVIAANFFGNVFIEGASAGNTITGNYIGMKTTGSEAITGTFNVPAFGIQLNADGNRVGGVSAGERNVITGSNRGIIIGGASNLVQGNYVGTDATGSFALTTQLDGVMINGANNTIGGTTGTTLGGPCTGSCNLISGNGQNGLNNGLVISGSAATGNVVDGNYIGLNAAGTASVRNGGVAGKGLLIFNSSGNVIGRPTQGARAGTDPAGNTNILFPPVICVQDDVTKDFIKFDAMTGAYEGKICNPVIPIGPGSGTISTSQSGTTMLGADVDARFSSGSPRAGAGFLFHLPAPFLLLDSNVDDNFDCSCPATGEQIIAGLVELGGANSSNNNDLNDFVIGIAADGETVLNTPDQTNIWISNGTGNNVTNVEMASAGTSNILATGGFDNSFLKNTYIYNDGAKAISTGTPNTTMLGAQFDSEGRVHITGTLKGEPNTRYFVSVYGLSLDTRQGAPQLVTGQPLRDSFEVMTDGTGSAMVDRTGDYTASFMMSQLEYFSVDITEAGGPGMSPTGATFGSTLEMPPRATITAPGLQVAGKVTTPTGLGLRNAVVAITDSLGVRQTATTSSFGVYSFGNIRRGETYVIGVSSKRYRFAARSLQVNGNLTNVDFVGLE